jgi:hypothetical protein
MPAAQKEVFLREVRRLDALVASLQFRLSGQALQLGDHHAAVG